MKAFSKDMRKKNEDGEDLLFDGRTREDQKGSVRILLSSTRFIASLFWLTIIVATMVFVLPYSEQTQSPVFFSFLALSIVIFLAHRYFPYEGYHPVAFFMLLLGTDALIAVMVYLAGGSSSSMSLLFLTVIIFSSVYFELLETMLITALTCAIYFAPLSYEPMSFETLKNMAVAVPIFFLIALCGFFVISKAREQEREKKALTHLFDQADTKRRELSTLYAVSLKFASTLDEDEMITILLDNACALVPNDAIAISILQPQGGLRVRASLGIGADAQKRLNTDSADNPLYVSSSAVLPVIMRDLEEDTRFRPFLEDLGYRSMIAVPLYASSSVVGVLACASRHAEVFDDDDARLLLTLASEAAVALEKASLYRTTLEDKTKIEAIIRTLTDGLAVIDREANLVLANPSILETMGWSEEDYDRPLEDLLRRSSHTAGFKKLSSDEALKMVLQEGRSLTDELSVGTEPATIFQVLWVPLQDSGGGINGAVLLLHDITYFVELDRMKSDFISIVSHELRTPLTSIKGFVRLLSAQRVGPVNEKQRHYLDIVQSQTESLTMLINDLLDLSRIESGIIKVRQEPVLLEDVIGGVVQQLENMAREKGVSIEIDVPKLPEIRGDQERLSQIFMNLIHNAIKYTPQGGRVVVKASPLGESCLVQVSDSGIGIAPQDLSRVFNKFYQVDSSSTRQQAGTGLGLSITKQLVSAHGGDIWVKSARDRGTTFSLTLPFCRPETVESREGSRLGEAATG